jgi:hypothetical protein
MVGWTELSQPVFCSIHYQQLGMVMGFSLVHHTRSDFGSGRSGIKFRRVELVVIHSIQCVILTTLIPAGVIQLMII